MVFITLANEHVSDASKDNKVVRTTPATGSRVGTMDPLTIFCGRTANLIPNLVGKTEAEARAVLTSLGVTKITSGYYPTTDHPDGSVYNVHPDPGSVIKADTSVSLSVSRHEGAIRFPSWLEKPKQRRFRL